MLTNDLVQFHATSDDVTDWRALAACLEAEVRVHYESFLFDRQRRIDDAMWKSMETDSKSGDLHVYRERSSHGHAPLGPQATLAAQSSVGRVLLVGVAPGTVDDALFGCSFHDTATLRTRDAYQHECLEDSAVLLAVESPALKDPFRFLGITWHLRTLRLSGRKRDCLLLERTYRTTLSTGDRVGVSLRHSIQHRDLPAARDPSTTRVTISSVTFYREMDANRVEVFGIELLDEKRRTSDALRRHDSVHDLMISAHVCATGFKKKLVWFLEQQRKRYHPAAALPPSEDKYCAACILCAKHVCSRCSETHEIVMDASEHEIEMDAFAFCAECVSTVKKLPTQRIAREQVVRERDQQEQ